MSPKDQSSKAKRKKRSNTTRDSPTRKRAREVSVSLDTKGSTKSFAGTLWLQHGLSLKNGKDGKCTPLSSIEAELWSQGSYAASCAARLHFPCHALRRLGTITRTISSRNKILETKSTRHQLASVKELSRGSTTAPKVPKAFLRRLAKARLPKDICEDEDSEDEDEGEDFDEKLEKTMVKLNASWLEAHKKYPRLKNVPWSNDGELPADELKPSHLLNLLSEGRVRDAQPDLKVSLYQGLVDIPVHLKAVLEAFKELSSVEDLYRIPLIFVQMEVEQMSLENGDGAQQHFCVSMGVYCHRLLFEVITTTALQTVMAALDDGSYMVKRPLRVPPGAPLSTPNFASDPNVQIVYTDVDSNENVLSKKRKASGDDNNAPRQVSAFSPEGFMKLIENHGVNIERWPEIQKTLEGKLTVDLLLHQIHGVCWMRAQEEEDSLNGILWEERIFADGGSYFYSPALGQIRLSLSEDCSPKGGVLADEMGLGKTVQVVALILSSLEELREQAKHVPGAVHTTLVVVPPALVSQWLQELSKLSGNSLIVDFFCRETLDFERKTGPSSEGKERQTADICLTTYQSLQLQQYGGNSNAAVKILGPIKWGRIVLDEMQEIRSSTNAIAKNCANLRSDRRWMLSGTPLFDGIRDLNGELSFLKLEPFASNCDDGFFDFCILQKWEAKCRSALDMLRVLSLFMLRRSKSMTIRETQMPLMGLLPLKILFEPVEQDPSERAVYCFLEYITHSLLQKRQTDGATAEEANNRLLLRLLRQACTSSLLLNGGMNCRSELTSINRLMVQIHRGKENKRVLTEPVQDENVLSCAEAITYLSQVQDRARVREGYETTMTVGGGAGLSRRQRAVDSPVEAYAAVKEKVATIMRQLEKWRVKRAKANWHRLLEKVTMGDLIEVNTAPKYRRLWMWRKVLHGVESTAGRRPLSLRGRRSKSLPPILLRGWRPGPEFSNRTLWKQHGSKFPWAHPHHVLLSSIPAAVLQHQLQEAIRRGMGANERDLSLVPLSKSTSTWMCYVHFSTKSKLDAFLKLVRRQDGLSITNNEPIDLPKFEEKIKRAEQQLALAEAELEVYACSANQRNKAEAEKALKRAKKGLCIVSQKHSGEGHVVWTIITQTSRGKSLSTRTLLLSRSDEVASEARDNITSSVTSLQAEQLSMERLKRAIERLAHPSCLRATSSFEILQDIMEGRREETMCSVCIGPLGDGDNSGGKIALTRCGHMFCMGCLQSYWSSSAGVGDEVPCITCRKPFKLADIRIVDPKRRKNNASTQARHMEAIKLVKEAAKMMKESCGVMEPHLWEALYLVIKPPPESPTALHGKYTAIPPDFLAHLKHASKLPPACSQSTRLGCTSLLTSKLRALIHDIPKAERSVVFTSSKQNVHLLQCCLQLAKLKSLALFNGQPQHQSQRVLSAWQSSPNTVLVVQSGAAACGLTLTAARKMFILEPFLKQEEEKQAYARLHRFGQTQAVTCKVYYAPVSVESRILEWRRQRASDDETIQFAPLRSMSDVEEEENQTRFLLNASRS